jgi:hypothetical protein
MLVSVASDPLEGVPDCRWPVATSADTSWLCGSRLGRADWAAG